jgi:UDP-glucose 4-epimerase
MLVASPERAAERLGWQARRPSLEAMIEDAWRVMSATAARPAKRRGRAR